MSSFAALDREIREAFQRGWSKAHRGRIRPIGKAAITKVEQAGWDAAFTGKDFWKALEEYLDA